MTARPLGRCPTCNRGLNLEEREAMGLRNGVLLNALCPGRIGPSDIDHILHNCRTDGDPERLAFLEYKTGNVEPGYGQRLLHRSLRGQWQERDGDRRLDIRVQVLPQFPDRPDAVLQPIVNWLWPPSFRVS